jgi:hypothetical protein
MKTYMRSFRIRLVQVVFSLILLQPIIYGQVSYSVDFSLNEVGFETVSAEDGNTYNKVEYTNLSVPDELGKPFIPVKYVKLLVPSAEDVDSIVLKHIKKQEIPGYFFLLPV